MTLLGSGDREGKIIGDQLDFDLFRLVFLSLGAALMHDWYSTYATHSLV